jgi:hypothetical protein
MRESSRWRRSLRRLRLVEPRRPVDIPQRPASAKVAQEPLLTWRENQGQVVER